jgi:hypothetical protein
MRQHVLHQGKLFESSKSGRERELHFQTHRPYVISASAHYDDPKVEGRPDFILQFSIAGSIHVASGCHIHT